MNLLDRIAYDTGGFTVQEILSSFCKKILEIIDLVNKNEEVCDEAHTLIENIRNEVVPRLVDDTIKELQHNGYFDRLVNVTLIEQLRTELTTLINQAITDYTTKLDNFDMQLEDIINRYNNGLFIDIKNKYRGASIYIPYREDFDNTFEYNVDKAFETNCNTISICPIFWMTSKTGIISGYKWDMQKEEVLEKCKYVKTKGMKVLLKPHVGGEGIGSHGDIIPSDLNAWTDSYTNQLIELFDLCKDYVDIISISNEINGQSKYNYAKWKNCIDTIKAKKPSVITTNANTITELKTNVFLKDLDVLSCNLYVSINGDLSTDIEQQRRSLFTTSPALNDLFSKARELNKPIIITEVGILPFERSLQNPEAWGFTDDPPLSYEAQVRYYNLAIREYIQANNVIGVMVWNACDGFTFVDRPCQETLKKIFGGVINV